MVATPKKNGSPRRTVDLQKLNATTLRKTHQTSSPFNQVSIVSAHNRKTVLSTWNGYHILLLSPVAQDATTFITEWSRYRYRPAPQGFHGLGDGYTRRFDEITVDLAQKTRCRHYRLLWYELECSPMARETWVQSQVESYQRLKKWYLMPPCLTLSIIRYGSRVKYSNPGKE